MMTNMPFNRVNYQEVISENHVLNKINFFLTTSFRFKVIYAIFYEHESYRIDGK